MRPLPLREGVIVICFVISLFPMTAWYAAAFLILFVASKADGGLQAFGRALGYWIFFLASLFPLFGAYLTLTGRCPFGAILASCFGV